MNRQAQNAIQWLSLRQSPPQEDCDICVKIRRGGSCFYRIGAFNSAQRLFSWKSSWEDTTKGKEYGSAEYALLSEILKNNVSP